MISSRVEIGLCLFIFFICYGRDLPLRARHSPPCLTWMGQGTVLNSSRIYSLVDSTESLLPALRKTSQYINVVGSSPSFWWETRQDLLQKWSCEVWSWCFTASNGTTACINTEGAIVNMVQAAFNWLEIVITWHMLNRPNCLNTLGTKCLFCAK